MLNLRQAATHAPRVTAQDAFAASDVDRSGALSHDEFVSFDQTMHPDGPHLFEAANGRPVDGDYMFSTIDRLNTGSVSLEQVLQNGYLLSDPIAMRVDSDRI